MKMLVGLGNPGKKYENTKHNVGWMLLDAIADKLGTSEGWRKCGKALVVESRLGAEKLILVKPLTYMNLSGEAVGPLVNWYKLDTGDVMVAHDDMDIPVGTIRIRKKGSAGGHNGIKSLLQHLPDENFARIRIGIGRPLPGWSVVDHVLAAFNEDQRPLVDESVKYLIPAVECIVTNGIDFAMNKYNPKKQKKEKSAWKKEQAGDRDDDE